MGANTDRFQYRGQGTSAPGPGTSGGPQPQIEGGPPSREGSPEPLRAPAISFRGPGSWPRGSGRKIVLHGPVEELGGGEREVGRPEGERKFRRTLDRDIFFSNSFLL